MRTPLLLSLIAVGLFHSVNDAQPSAWSVPDPAHGTADEFYCQAFGPGLPFIGINARHERLAEGMVFAAFPLEQPPIEADDAPPQDPIVPDQPAEMRDPPAAKPAPFPATTPSVVADQSVGLAFLIVGVAGWILLTLAFLILVSRQPRSRPDEPRTEGGPYPQSKGTIDH